MHIRPIALRTVSLSPHAHALQKRNRVSVPTVGRGGQSTLVKIFEHIPKPAQNSIGFLPLSLMFSCDLEAQLDLPRFVPQTQPAPVPKHLPSLFHLSIPFSPPPAVLVETENHWQSGHGGGGYRATHRKERNRQKTRVTFFLSAARKDINHISMRTPLPCCSVGE